MKNYLELLNDKELIVINGGENIPGWREGVADGFRWVMGFFDGLFSGNTCSEGELKKCH